MTVHELWVEGYRSIHELRLSLAPVTVVVRPNGCGKTNLYRALRLLSAAAEGTVARSLADEGGLPSVLWAGPRKKNAPARFTVGAAMDELAYELSCGPMPPPQVPFELDPDVKEETVWAVHFRTDPDAPLRRRQVGVRTPALAHDGRDLAAALMTVQEIGDRALLHESVERAFPGAKLELIPERGTFSFRLAMPGLFRPLEAAELSDGTLRYLCLIAALLSSRTPPFLALNEPETSLHSDLLPALAELIADAGERGQVLVTTHAETLAAALEKTGETSTVRLAKRDGATVVAED